MSNHRLHKNLLVLALSAAFVLAGFLGGEKAVQAATVEEATKTVIVEKLTLDQDVMSKDGGTVNVIVEGENLTEDNWGMEARVFVEDSDYDATNAEKSSKITVVNQSASGAVLNVSPNRMANNLEVTITAGKIEDGRVLPQATASFKIHSKGYRTKELDFSQTPELLDGNTVTMSFEQEIQLKEDLNLSHSISLAASNGNTYNLGDEDQIVCEDRRVVITCKKDILELLNIEEGAAFTLNIQIDEGVFEILNQSAKYCNAAINWSVAVSPRISSIELDKEVLACQGGKVTAYLKGYRVEDVSLDHVTAEIYLAGENSASTIQCMKVKNASGRPMLRFVLPENTTKNTQSYWINVKDGVTPVYQSTSENRAQMAVVSVLAKGMTEEAQTLSAMSISGNNSEPMEGGIQVNVSSMVGSLKTEVRIFGTNLDPNKTKLRAIDENGIIWPVYDIPECDGVWRFIAIAGVRKNGVFGEGNTQIIELLPPRYAGTDKCYKIQVSIDGENFIEDQSVNLQVNNANISGEPDYRDCTSENFKYVKVHYVDETGNALAESDTYKGYCISMVEQFGIAPKEISGYQLLQSPTFDEWVEEGRTYTYVYGKIEENHEDVSPITMSKVITLTRKGKTLKITKSRLSNKAATTLVLKKVKKASQIKIKKGAFIGTKIKTIKVSKSFYKNKKQMKSLKKLLKKAGLKKFKIKRY